ncbi:MAG: radical SAM protein [Candidatus Omnitrophica bacterium]|nr:radical SAM protein [Candidatus Omnitrophota bacterium]
MKYIYGPIKSRRLGLSLGLSLSSDKTCNLDCVYCQWGKTEKKVFQRNKYVNIDEIIKELESWLDENFKKAKKLKFLTISGLGEPTLHTQIGELINRVRKITNYKIAVITNSTLLGDPFVRKALLDVDLIVPSLDAVDEKIFKQVDRPHADVNLNEIIAGLIALRKEFHGKIWLEIMLISGVNDDIRHIKKLKKIIQLISPDRIQLNSPVRATTEKDVLPVGKTKLEKIKKILGNKAEII